MVLAQIKILRRSLRLSSAVVTLVAWQTVCVAAKVGNVNHFLWDGQYNFSRAVGAAAMWQIVALLSDADQEVSWRRQSGLIALAWFSTTCHVATGAIAFGTLLIHAVARLAALPSRRQAGIVFSIPVVGVATLLYGSRSDSMIAIAHGSSDGSAWLPVSLEPLLWLWVPVFLSAAWKYQRFLFASFNRGPRIGRVSPLMSAVIAAGMLQALLLAGRASGQIIPYAYKSALFYTFPLAALLLIERAAIALQRWSIRSTISQSIWRRTMPALAAVSFAIGLAVTLKKDCTRPGFSRGRDPVQATRLLLQHSDLIGECLYVDPQQPFGSLFVNLAAIRPLPGDIFSLFEKLKSQGTLDLESRHGQERSIIFPAAETPSDWIDGSVTSTPIGPFLQITQIPIHAAHQ